MDLMFGISNFHFRISDLELGVWNLKFDLGVGLFISFFSFAPIAILKSLPYFSIHKTCYMKTLWIVAFMTITFTACNNSTAGSPEAKQEAKEERNKNIALASVSAVGKGNLDSVFKDVAPDAIDYREGSNPPLKGLDSAKAGLKSWM